MFIRNMAAAHSLAGGSAKKARCLFGANSDKRSLFTLRYDGCRNLLFPVCTVINHRLKSVDYVYYLYVLSDVASYLPLVIM